MRILSAHIQFIYKTYKKTDVFISEDVPKFHSQIEAVNLRIAHLRIGYLVGNPEVGNPDPYQLSGLPTFIITLFMCCPGLIWPLKVWCSHVQCILKQYSRFCYFIFIFQ